MRAVPSVGGPLRGGLLALGAMLIVAASAQAASGPSKPAAPKASTPPAAAQPAPAAPAAPAVDQSNDDAKDDAGKNAGQGAGLPIPRFVSLRTEPINLRVGPGPRYPVDWVYRRRFLPVEVTAEFDNWRKIRDPDGTEGWVYSTMLSGRRTAMVKGEMRRLRRNNADDSDQVAKLEAGVIVNVQRCPQGPFCRVEVNGVQGWLKRDEIWGVYPDETVE